MNEVKIPYYPKGYGVMQSLKNLPLFEFKIEDSEYLIKEYGSLDNFVDRFRDIRDFFKTTKEEALSRMYEKIEENELFDDYYDDKYGMPRLEAIDNDLQTDEDLEYEKEMMMKEDKDTIFDFSVGMNDDEMKEFLNELAQFHLLVLEECFRHKNLDMTNIQKLKEWITPQFDIEETKKKIEEDRLSQTLSKIILDRSNKGEEIGVFNNLNSDILQKIYQKI